MGCRGCGERLRRRRNASNRRNWEFARSGRARPPDQARNGTKELGKLLNSLARPMASGHLARSGGTPNYESGVSRPIGPESKFL